MTQRTQLQILLMGSSGESRVSLRRTLSLVSDFCLVDEIDEPARLLEKIGQTQIDFVLFCFPEIDAVGLTKQIRATNPNIRVLILTASDNPDDIFAALDAGADAYVLKSHLSSTLEIAIRSVRSGSVWLDPGIAKQVLQVAEAPPAEPSRILPTGLLRIPLMPDEKSVLTDVASGNCKDGVCMVDPSFLRKLKRFSTTHTTRA